ncbi:protein of unknown function [Methylorubrum extorquens]|uniref:Uncharacterized protein n=1 Tax=Methylorubrum extorquens TaxID=408 RepID=A0A2N9AMW6_METEX|nr:protein of unknown function [Methylorubrum extorquens]
MLPHVTNQTPNTATVRFRTELSANEAPPPHELEHSRSLVAMAAEEATTRSFSHLRAEVRDEAGKRIMTAQVSVSVRWTAEANAAEEAMV